MTRLILALFTILLPPFANASSRHIQWPGPYTVTVAAVLDGDSIVVALDGDCPFGCREGIGGKPIITVRIAGIDAPEIHACRGEPHPSCAACPEELALAQRAKAEAVALAGGAGAVRIADLSPDKYSGRIVGDLQIKRAGEWVSLGAEMLRQGLAVPYDGGKKSKPWCGGGE